MEKIILNGITVPHENSESVKYIQRRVYGYPPAPYGEAMEVTSIISEDIEDSLLLCMRHLEERKEFLDKLRLKYIGKRIEAVPKTRSRKLNAIIRSVNLNYQGFSFSVRWFQLRNPEKFYAPAPWTRHSVSIQNIVRFVDCE